MKSQTKELRFPTAGVVRRLGFGVASDLRAAAHRGAVPAYSSPWAVNVRPEDPLQSRLRGGSRPGLSKYSATQLGATVSSMVAVPVASASGVSTKLVIIGAAYFRVATTGGVVSAPMGYLLTEAGDYVVTEAGDKIMVSTAAAPTVSGQASLVAAHGLVYSIASSIRILDPISGRISTLAASAGTVPTTATFGCVYRDRLVLGGDDNMVFFSRQGDFGDWNYAAAIEDTGRATPIQVSESGEIGRAITALIPHKDDSLLVATSRGLWVIKGDPCSGAMRCVSRDTGIVCSSAWCVVGDSVVFLSENGLYSVSASGADLTPLSDDRLPEELEGIDPDTYTVLLAHKHDEYGVHLFVTPTDPGEGEETDGDHWYFDLVHRGFWLDSLQTTHQPTAVCEIEGEVVLAGSDGYLRSIGGDDDDGTNIESHLLIGPLQLDTPGSFGLMQNLHGITGVGSGSVTWRIVAGDTAEEACQNAKTALEAFQAGSSYASYVKASGAWSAGRSHAAYPRVRAVWAVLWLQSTAKWAYESVQLTTIPFGRWR